MELGTRTELQRPFRRLGTAVLVAANEDFIEELRDKLLLDMYTIVLRERSQKGGTII